MEPSIDDEKTHRPGAHRFWNESFYFNFFDATTLLGGATRIGFSPNRAHREAFLILYLPDGEMGFVRMHAPLTADGHGAPGQAIDAPPLEFTCEAPMRRWRVRYDGPLFTFADGAPVADLMQLAAVDHPRRRLSLDLAFESLHPPYDFHASSTKRPAPLAHLGRSLGRGSLLVRAGLALEAARALPAMSGASHYEQAVRVRGTLGIDGASHTIDGFGQRDHSWGVRDMRVPSSWRWISAQFGDELCFNATRVDVLGLEVRGGYTFHQGKCAGLTGFAITPDAGPDGRYPPRFHLRLARADASPICCEVEVLAQLPVAIETEGRGTLVNECLARFHWNGRSTLGIVEAMVQRFP